MSRSSASLVKLWEGEGQSSTSSKPCTVTSAINTNAAGSVIKAELLKYYQKHGLETMAKEVGIIHANGDVSSSRAQATPRKTIITLPVKAKVSITTKNNSGAPVAMSPFKMEHAILPKSYHYTGAPMILSTPQKIVTSVINSPRTPQTASNACDQSNWSGKRPHGMNDPDYIDCKKKKQEKAGKGLRHFSMKVCEKVRRKGTTSYNEVADELVAEFTDPHRNMCPTEQAYDQKNIRRRVYDALNVLMAMNIISKEKKEIKWLGLPTNSAQEYQTLEKEKQKKLERIRAKTQQLQELIHQQIAFKNIVERNKTLEKKNTCPPMTSRIHLPFIIINTDKNTIVECSISPDKTEFLFNFNDTFQIHDDIEILKRMGMVLDLDKGNCTREQLDKAKQLVPKNLQPYVIHMAQGLSDYPPGMSEEGNDLRFENNPFSEPTSDFQEPSSSSMFSSDYMSVETVLTSPLTGLSRQSSVGSLTDIPSRPEMSTPSEDFSDSDIDSSGPED